MSKITITRTLEIDAGHRVLNHESKCANLHGHRYKFEITAVAEKLDSLGRVIDFSEVKKRLGTWLDENWDHTMIIFDQDFEALSALVQVNRNKPIAEVPFNPTAENMAEYLLNSICPELFKDSKITVSKVKIWETPNCVAEASNG